MALKQTPGAGVFDQIKNMIQKMIFHLMSGRASRGLRPHLQILSFSCCM